MKGKMTMPNSVSLRLSIVAGVLLWLAPAANDAAAKDEPQFGPAVDAFCTSENRIPATPFADGKSSFPLTECQLCHQPLTFDKTHVTEGFNQYKLATRPENLRPDGTPDFSWFCPDSAAANQPPVLAPIGSWTLNEGEQVAFALNASDPDGDNLWFDAANLPTGATLTDNGNGSADFSWTPTYAQSGNFDVTFIVTDDGAPTESDSETVTFMVGDVNRAPILEAIGNWSAEQGTPLAFTTSASDPDGDNLHFDGANLPAGAVLTDHGDGSADFSWTPAFDQSGNFAVTFIVSDDGSPMESDSEQITITVGNVNRPPVLDPIGNRMATEGDPLTIMLMATDPDGDAVSFAAATLPAGAQLVDYGDGSAQVDWTPIADQVGNHPVTFSVHDAGTPSESDSEEVTISVASASLPPENRPPVLDPVGDRTLTEGQPSTIVLTASDPDGDGLGFAAAGLPAGASLLDHGDGSAEISWTPGSGELGEHAVTCSVTDDGTPPESDSETAMFRVQAGATADLPGGSLYLRRAMARRGHLLVKGRGAAGVVELVDYDSGEVLGSTEASGKGGFRIKLYLPTQMPCTVQARDAQASSSPLPVEHCMQAYGKNVRVKKAIWRADRGLLVVSGRNGPSYGHVDLYDDETGELLGSAGTDHAGRFRFQGEPGSIPCRVHARAGDFVSAAAPVKRAVCGSQ